MSEQFLYFLQQMFNGVTLGSTYALIAIGYTMVYGIIGMINFAHGEVYMIGSYVAFMVMAGLMMMGIDSTVLLLGGALPGQHHHHRQLWLVHRTGGLSSTAGRQPPDPPHLRHRHVDLPAEHDADGPGLA
ncbi:ABC transporter permease subunit [Escherichia coli]